VRIAALIEPAVKGTVGILKSIEKNGPGIQRVVITSSVAAVMDASKPSGTIYTEVGVLPQMGFGICIDKYLRATGTLAL
jgi:nucleoside-diphosphate-sugar epimerase